MVDTVAAAQAEAEQEQSYDTSDKEQVNKSRKKAARTRAHRQEFIKASMGLKEGRAWFYDILLYCKIWDELFVDDPYRTAFLCGRRNVGTRILDDIQEVAGDEYVLMLKENK